SQDADCHTLFSKSAQPGAPMGDFMKLAVLAAAAAACLTLATAAQADVVIDRSPEALGLSAGFNAANVANGQNFLVRFHLDVAASVTGADVFSSYPSN